MNQQTATNIALITVNEPLRYNQRLYALCKRLICHLLQLLTHTYLRWSEFTCKRAIDVKRLPVASAI